MREIDVGEVTRTIKDMCIKANCQLPEDVKSAIDRAFESETWPMSRQVLETIRANIGIASKENMPLCQDTGMACVFMDIGQDVHFTGGDLTQAINKGVALGYTEGFLRKSVVSDPVTRKNTGDNTPAVIYYNIVPGDKVEITVAPKGFGSENMSRSKMLTPAHGVQGIKDFVISTVKEAGPNPCPPVVVGVGIGGTFDKVAYLAKKALLRPIGELNKDPVYRQLESELLEDINRLGIGPAGFGGRTTALAVHIESYPTHIAGLPVAVNINCHVARHVTCEI